MSDDALARVEARMRAERTTLLSVERVSYRIRNPPKKQGQSYEEWDDARERSWPLDDVYPSQLTDSAIPIDKGAVQGFEDGTRSAWLLMTPTQSRTVRSLVRGILEQDGMSHDAEFAVGREFKKLEITHQGRDRKGGRGTIWLYTTVGMVDDEGTMAQVFCRVTRHISISPRGKVELWNRARWVGKSGDDTNPLRKVSAARGRGLWSAIHDPTL